MGVIYGHDECRAFYDDFVALHTVRKVLGSLTDLSLVDEQWVGALRMMIDTLTRLRKVIDFHQARIAFEKVLKHYRRYRQELEDEVKTLLRHNKQFVETLGGNSLAW